jgi:hypothetical protein
MKYTTYFYDKPYPRNKSDYFANPTQDFYSLEDARRFARYASDTGEIAKAGSFRIETDDGKINEQWIRDRNGWELSR